MKKKSQKWIIGVLVFVLFFLMSNSLSAGEASPVEFGASVFEDNFESYDLGNLAGQGGWTGSTSFQVVNDQYHTGSKSVYWAGNGGTYLTKKSGNDLTTGNVEFWFRVGNNSIKNASYGYFFLNSNDTCGGEILIRYCQENDVSVYIASMSPVFTLVRENLSLNTWYKITIEWNAGTKKYRAKLNDYDWTDLVNMVQSDYTSINQYGLTADYIEIWFDDISEPTYPFDISCTLYNNSPRFSKPFQVNSVCADGSDATLLKVSFPEALDPNGIAMEVMNSGEAGEDGSIRITQRQIGKIEAVYTTPNNFCRSNHSEDAGLKSRPITIRVAYQGEEQSQFQFQLYRPPIVMLHGLWGDSLGWDDVINCLIQERNLYPQQLLFNYSYYSSNASSFEENKDVCNSAILVGLSQARRLGYSAGKVDVIAHNMGGLLVRWYLHNLGTKHYQGDIHKFISIGVPHSGSQLADLAMTPGYYPVLRWIFGKIDKPIDKGAIDNLRVDSPVIDIILNNDIPPENIVPSHAIATTTVYLGEDDPGDFWWVRVLYEFFSVAYDFDIDLISVALFRESNDYVVALSSQKGGSLSTTHFEDISHGRQLKAGIVKDKIVDLLNARPSSPDFAMSGFHPIDLNFAMPFEAVKLAKTTKLAVETSETESVKIVSPASGTVVDAGTVINVNVQATGSVDRVLIAGKDMVYTKTALPFDFSCSLPAEIIGSYNIVAVGFGANNVTATDEIQLQVRTLAQLVGFRTYPSSLLIVIEGEKADFQVLGEFSDFVLRDITSSENGTSYSTLDTGIAVVVGDGIIQGVQTGETTLTISNSGLTTTLTVSVIEKSFYRTAVGLSWFFYE